MNTYTRLHQTFTGGYRPHKYDRFINTLFTLSTAIVLFGGALSLIDSELHNNQFIYASLVFASLLLLTWWLSSSGRHIASIIAGAVIGSAALLIVLFQRSSAIPGFELAAIISVAILSIVLELRRTRTQLRAERDMLEQRVIERTEALEAEQLRRTLEMQRFAEFGRLSAQLLHDVSNPLTAASLYLQQVDTHTSDAVREARRNLRQLEQYVQSARFQLQKTGEPRNFNVQQELRQLLRLLKPMACKSNVKIVVTRGEHQTITGDPVKFHQIMANVIANAIDACSATDNTKQQTVTIRIDHIARYVRICVHDTGKGITPQAMTKIFEPFYTTKQQDGRGLGIGLATVRRTLRDEFCGTICAKSTPQDGTTFTMLLRAEQPLIKNQLTD